MITGNKWKELRSLLGYSSSERIWKNEFIVCFLKTCYLMIQVQRNNENNWCQYKYRKEVYCVHVVGL